MRIFHFAVFVSLVPLVMSSSRVTKYYARSLREPAYQRERGSRWCAYIRWCIVADVCASLWPATHSHRLGQVSDKARSRQVARKLAARTVSLVRVRRGREWEEKRHPRAREKKKQKTKKKRRRGRISGLSRASSSVIFYLWPNETLNFASQSSQRSGGKKPGRMILI